MPVIMVTALDQPSDRVKGLEAGADDFLTKPVDDIPLITRVKNLARLKMLTDEMLMRATTEEQMGFATTLGIRLDEFGRGGRIALRLCSQVRSLDRIRHLPIMIGIEPGDDARLLRGLDMGVNDYIVRPVDANELLARVRTQVKRKRYTDHLRMRLEETVEMAILDPLTALHNRRYMTSHLKTLFEESSQRGKPLSVLVLDIDYFKAVMTAMAMTRVTRCCGSSPPASAATFAASTSPAGSAARNSSWSCRIPTSPRPILWASAYANVSLRRRFMPGSGSERWK